MSQEVDERVVEMRFDNAQFERNTRQSIKTLNELERSLKLEGAEKGFARIEDASENVDFDRMTSALENLNSKFSAVEVIGVTALMRITNQAIDTGERLVKSLSVDQVTSGWSKYAQKTASVQTIMNATGKSITKVNSYLDKLMWYSDETSYGFTDMTASLGQLTAAGGDIDKLIPMIMGIANATAYAGKGASEFSRVIYNLNQSYSQGYLSLMDWKSVELAGVATAELKKQLIATGVELGRIKEGDVTVGTFSTSLSKKWADKEVMETAFGKLAEFTQAVKKMVDANPGMIASQAIEQLADQYDEVTVKAFKAAQEAKSFSEAVDATKDAVSSGWMETFDILFGNYEEAKHFWSDLAEEFWNLFAGGANARNNWLRSAFDSGLDQMLGTEGFSDASDNFTKLLEKSLTRSGLLTEEAIEKAGSFQKALEESGVTAQQLGDVVASASGFYGELAAMSDEEFAKTGYNRQAVLGLAQAYSNMVEKIQNGEASLDEFSGKMNRLSGREHFFAGILNILDGANSLLNPVREAFGEVFMTDGSPLYHFLEGFDELTGKMALSEETAEKVQKVFTGVFSVLSIGLKGVKTVGKTAFMILGKLLDLLSPMGDLLLNIGSYIGNLLTWVDVSLGQAESLSDVLGILVGAVAALVSPIADVVKGVKTLVRGGNMEEAKKQFGAFSIVVDAAGSVLDKFKIGSVSAGNVIGTAFQLLGGILLGAFEGAGALIGRAFNGFKGAGDMVSEFADSKVPLLENIRDVVQSLPEKAEKALADFGRTLTGIMTNISGACRNALSAVKDFFNLQDGVDLYRLLALIDVGALAAAIYGATVLLKKASDNFKKTLANPIGDFFKSLTGAVNTWTKAHTTNNLVTAAKAIATAVALISGSMYLLAKIDDPMQAAQALASVISELFSMVVALKVLAATDLTGLDTAKLIGTIVAISIGMAALTNTVAKLGKMDADQAEKGVEAVGHIAAMLAGMTGLLALFNKQLGGVKGAGGFVAAAAAVDMIALALIPLAKAEANGLDIDGAVKAINGVAIAISILTVAAGFAQKLAGKADVSTLDKIIKYLVKLGGILIAINAMGTALLMAAGAVAIFANLGDRMMDGIRGAGLVVSGIAALLVLMANTKVNPLRMKKGAESMAIASASLLVMAAAVKQMGKAMETDTGGAGMAGVSLMLIGLAGALYLLGKQAPESTAAAVAMVAMGAAMIEMALAIKMLADVDFANIVKSVFSLAAALGVLIAGCWGLGFVSANLASAAGACLMLATALLILTPAFKGLASLTAGEAFAGVIGTIGIMLGLFAIGAIAPVATGMVVFSACLISLGKAFSAFAGGLVKLSIAAAILAVLSLFADPVCKAIIEAEPDIEEALIAVITGICNVIVACAEPIAKALFVLAAALTVAVVYYIAWILGAADTSLGTGLDQIWDNLQEWFRNHSLLDLYKTWICATAEKLYELNPFGLYDPPDMNGLPAQAGGWLADRINEFDKTFGTRIMGRILEAWGFEVQYVDDATDAVNNAAEAANSSASKIDGTAKALSTATNAANAQTDAYVQLETSEGKLLYVTQEQAAALLAGTTSLDELAGANDVARQAIGDTGDQIGQTADTAAQSAAQVEGIARQIGTKEGEVADKAAEAVEGGLAATEKVSEEAGGNAATSFLDGMLEQFRNSDFGSTVRGLMSDALNGLQIPKVDVTDVFENNGINLFGKGNTGLLGGLTKEDLEEDIQKGDEDKDKNGSGGGRGGKTAGTKKTLAEQIEEKYKERLAANKTAREILDSEYELWQTENQYSAGEDALLGKKMENAAAEITNQTDRVAIAQQKYDELFQRWGAGKQETREAYNDLLEEKVNLAKLKADQYTDLFEEITKRYDTNLDTLEKEYSLWTAQNDGTATKLEKIDRETRYQTEELELKQKKEAKAREQWETLRTELGEQNLQTQQAYNDYLDAQTESLEIQNDLAKKGLDRLDAQIEQMTDAQDRMQSRMDLLTSIYGDGSLSERADAYKQAVEEYGENSAQAKKAKYQGITTSILGTVGALQNMNSELQQTYKLQELLQNGYTLDANGNRVKLTEEERKNYEDQLLSSRSALVGFAGTLADAMNLNDTAKTAVTRLANAIQKNWKPIQDDFTAMLDKLTGSMDEGVRGTLSKVLGTAFSEDGVEIGTEFLSAFASAMQGDYASAVIGAVTGVLDLMYSDAGREMMSGVRELFEKAMPEIQNGTNNIAESIAFTMSQIKTMGEGSGGVTATLANIGTVLESVGGTLMAFLSEFWWVFLIIGAIAAVIGGIAWYANNRKKQSDNNIYDVGKDLNKDFAQGVEDGFDTVDDAVTNMTQNAVDIAKGALSTIDRVMGNDYEYTPQITPVVDLSNVLESADEATSAFEATTKAMSLDDDVSRKLASQIEAQAEIQNGLKASAGNDTLAAINGLAEHVDGVAQSIKGMSVNINGRKTIGYIDSEMGRRVAAKVR